ncbi:serine/threonine-protein kinase PknK [Engelhardtia mirabilis]|uniref:non-specific serine/threonine protein kinase n=1 Tax=Engelhardtia mirabilis TaxID=2528011 RepID=A0A518BMP0_9BACT|nr:Serine/threonine-protein kinase PK-1 [Planctomycetes bacterium Pla133]QDV02578.1 Serine/threonine-protein kinase PK-1 [Planctomycetes bacterium Pla86]
MTQLSGYEIERELGAGAGGRVLLARATRSIDRVSAGDLVALKVPSAEGAERARQVEALAREAAVARRVRHPSLVRVLAFREDAELPYLSMVWVPGATLSEVLAEGEPLPEPRLREIGADLGSALAALHAHDLVHGDVKPENVRLDAEGRAVLIDLGFARDASLDGEGGLPGTLAFLAPEFLSGGRSGPPSDVFALGAVLYLLATGHHPFGADDGETSDLLAALATARVVPASRHVPELSPLLDALLDACLRRSPSERPTAEALAGILHEGEESGWWRARVQQSLGSGGGPGALRAESHRLQFVGRRDELRGLSQAYTQVLREGQGLAIALSGPVGIGKTRLVSDLIETLRAGDSPCLFLHARCSELTESQRYGTAIRLLEHWLQLPPHRPLGPREIQLLEHLVPPRDADVLRRALLGDGDAPVQGSAAVALAAWIAALAAGRPVVVLVDDLHLAHAATLEALDRMLERSADSRLLLLLAYDDDRPPAEPAELARLLEHARRRAAQVDLAGTIHMDPLTVEDVTELVTHHFHHTTPRLRLGRVLHERSQGNPGILEELLVGLVDRGEAAPLDGEPGRLRLEIQPDRIALPGSLLVTMRQRYRELDPLMRRWLERLSVVGGRLETDFLCTAFAPATAAEVDGALEELARRGWLVANGPRYRFARAALREAVYRSLSPDRRVRLHRMAARALATIEDDRDVDFQRAYHLRAAGEQRELLEAVWSLLPPDDRRGSPHRLLRLARWGLEALDALGRPASLRKRELNLLERGLGAADRLGERELQRRWLDRLAELATGTGTDAAEEATVYLLHGRHAYSTGEFGTARGMLRNAVGLAKKARDARIEVEALRGWALVEAEFASTSRARQLAARALSASVEPEQRALAHLVSARIEVLDDRLERALDDVRSALATLRLAGREAPGIRAGAYLMRARVWRAAGRVNRALASARRAQALAREAGDRRREAEAAARMGWLLLDADRPDEAEAQLREARLVTEEIEDQRAGVLVDLWLGLLLCEQQVEGGRASIQRALATADDIGYHRAEALGRAILARVQLLDGDDAAALRNSDRAHELSEIHGLELIDRIVVDGTCAVMLRHEDRGSEADGLVRSLRRRIRRTTRNIRRPDLRLALGAYTERLLEAVLTLDGPIYPRSTANVATLD